MAVKRKTKGKVKRIGGRLRKIPYERQLRIPEWWKRYHKEKKNVDRHVRGHTKLMFYLDDMSFKNTSGKGAIPLQSLARRGSVYCGVDLADGKSFTRIITLEKGKLGKHIVVPEGTELRTKEPQSRLRGLTQTVAVFDDPAWFNRYDKGE